MLPPELARRRATRLLWVGLAVLSVSATAIAAGTSAESAEVEVTFLPPPPPPATPPTVAQVIVRTFPDVPVAATHVAWCESRHDPTAVSGTDDHGLFQINEVHRESFEAVTGVPFDEGVYDPVLNARFARWLYEREGWAPWTCA